MSSVDRKIAHLVSWVFNPGCMAIGLLVAGTLVTATLSRRAIFAWLFVFAMFTLLGLFVLLLSWARGIVLDADLTTGVDLRQRSRVLSIFALFILIMLAGLYQTGSDQPLFAFLVSTGLVGACVALITKYWKISLHMVGVGAFVTAILLVAGLEYWFLVLLVPIVAWSRLHLGRHTIWQLLGGLLLGFSVTAAVLTAFGLF